VSGDDDTEKTEEASPEKRRKAREEGQFPRAKDTGAVASTFAVLLVLGVFGAPLSESLLAFVRECLSAPQGLHDANLTAVTQRLLLTTAWVTLPLTLAAGVAGFAAGVLEAGFEPRFELAAPKWSRLSPGGKLMQLFSPKEGATNVLLTLSRVGAVATVTYLVMKSHFADLTKLIRAPIEASLPQLIAISLQLAVWATFTLLVLAALDYIVAWFREEKKLRMSRQELKDEHQQQEGDPRIKARQRQRAREMATKGVAKRVKESDVVVTNPTHIAVAIRYRPTEGAPVINAKGYDEIAQHIKRLAKDNNITVLENKALARALAANGRVGKAIPLELYAAVAEVLAVVYRARDRRARHQ
jgi:flagellar biosynthetic protein FlhB